MNIEQINKQNNVLFTTQGEICIPTLSHAATHSDMLPPLTKGCYDVSMTSMVAKNT